MKEVQKIAQKVLLLLMDMLIFTWQVVRRVILPTRSRKGNLLSSLLTFIVGLLERAVSFEKSIVQRPVVFTHKYVKQALIVAVGFLFLLSSFEWSIGSSTDTGASGLQEVVACAPVMVTAQRPKSRYVDFPAAVPSGAGAAARSYIPSLSLTGPPVRGRKWLRLLVFRI